MTSPKHSYINNPMLKLVSNGCKSSEAAHLENVADIVDKYDYMKQYKKDAKERTALKRIMYSLPCKKHSPQWKPLI